MKYVSRPEVNRFNAVSWNDIVDVLLTRVDHLETEKEVS